MCDCAILCASNVCPETVTNHRNLCDRLMTRSFYEKADLEHWMKPDIHYSDYVDLLEDWYAHFVDNGLCFVVWDDADRMVGASVNTDANDEPEIEVRSKLSIVFEFLEEVEGPVR